jgi:hypothetical protein
LLWEGRQPAGRFTTLVEVVVSVEVVTLVSVVVCVAVVTDVAVMVVGGRDKGTRIRVADTRTPAINIAAATYARLLFPVPCNARPLDSNDGALPSVSTFVRTAPICPDPQDSNAKTLKSSQAQSRKNVSQQIIAPARSFFRT